MQTCGYCGGNGHVSNAQRDRYGPRPDYPSRRACEYCDGSGQCEDGAKLLPAGEAYQATDEDRERAGIAPWM